MSATRTAWRTPRRWAVRAGFIVVGILAGLLVAEAALGVTGIGTAPFREPDDQLGWRLRPGAEGWIGSTYVRINGAGYRDREHSVAKPRGTTRVAVIGDSYTEAFGVAIERAFWSVAERSLASCSGAARGGIEVLAFGVGSYGTAQELLLLRTRLWAYEPDIVVLQFTPSNDVRNNLRALEVDAGRPYFLLRDGELVLDSSFREADPGRWSPVGRTVLAAIARSRLLTTLNALRQELVARRAESLGVRDTAVPDDEILWPPHEEPQVDIVYRPPINDVEEQAWQVTERLIAAARDEVGSRGARFVLLVGTEPRQVHPVRLLRQEKTTAWGVADLDYANVRLAALARREAIAAVDLFPVFRDHVARTGEYLHAGEGKWKGFDHWNERGHEMVGQQLAEGICPLLGPRW